MAMNLRLRPDAAAALRAEAERSGVSQQEILRRAVDEHLGLGAARGPALPDWVSPPSRPYRRSTVRLRPPEGTTFADVVVDLRGERLS